MCNIDVEYKSRKDGKTLKLGKSQLRFDFSSFRAKVTSVMVEMTKLSGKD